jgi:hypothetical protein
MSKLIYFQFSFLLIFLITGCDSEKTEKIESGPGLESSIVTCETIKSATGFHVTVDGSSDGDGSLDFPWDLDTAFRHPSVVKPGDMIWVHGGIYRGTYVVKLDGEPDNPIIVSAWPGDRVTIDSEGSETTVLQLYHKWYVIRGFELTNSNTDRRESRATGIWAGADYVSLQNLIVHEVGTGISGGQLDNDIQQGTNIELYGCVFYNNGSIGVDRAHGHHIYLTNKYGKMRVVDNLIFSSYGSGVHAYSETDRNYVQGFEFTGNVWFLNGAPGGKLVDGCLIGHNENHPVGDILLKENYGWALDLNGRDVRMGWSAPKNNDAVLEDNYFVGLTVFLDDWSSVVLKGNEFIGSLEGLSSDDYPDNSYVSENPVENKFFIRSNRYEPGRAHIIVYNWEDLDEVKIDPQNIMPSGTSYILRNAEDYYGTPVLQGVYQGGELTIPMSGLNSVIPLGEPNIIPEKTGRQFNVFILEADICI